MTTERPRIRRLPTPAHVLLVAVLSLLMAVAVMDLWDADLGVPLEGQGDGMLHLAMVRGILDDGWPLVVERAGEPGDLDFRDFPALDNLNLLAIRLLAIAVREPALLINVFFLLTFPAIAAAAFVVARRVGLSTAASYLVALLYPMLPYHFGRGIGHLFLSAYWIVPPAVLLALELAQGRLLPLRRNRRRLVLFALFAFILGCSGVYYPFFACIFFGVAGITAAAMQRSLRPFAPAAAFIGVVLAAVVLNHAPSLIKEAREGSLEVADRVPAEAEMYGLKIAQLVLPVTDHRISGWARVKQRYNAGPLITENDLATLGLVGTVGFLFLLVHLIWVKPQAPALNWPHATINHLSILNVAGVLFGTIGGGAALFSLLVSPQIRSVNRISVFIAFFALLAAGFLFDRATRRRAAWVAPLAAAILVVFGTLDQTVRRYAHHADAASIRDLDRYVDRIESTLPEDAAVFQLPYFPFPENGWIHGISDYDHFRPLIYGERTRWSYGAVRGSLGDLWQKEVAALPPDAMVRTLALAGFDGIWLDRRGYPDRGSALEGELARAAAAVPFVSPDGNHAFIPLQLVRYRLGRELGSSGWERESARAVRQILVSWRSGFSGAERNELGEWRWGSRRGELVVHNLSDAPAEAVLRMVIETGRDDPSTLTIESPFWNETLSLGADPLRVERRFTVPPGTHRLRLRSTARPIDAPGDPRVLVFSVRDFSIRRADDEAAVPVSSRADR